MKILIIAIAATSFAAPSLAQNTDFFKDFKSGIEKITGKNKKNKSDKQIETEPNKPDQSNKSSSSADTSTSTKQICDAIKSDEMVKNYITTVAASVNLRHGSQRHRQHQFNGKIDGESLIEAYKKNLHIRNIENIGTQNFIHSDANDIWRSLGVNEDTIKKYFQIIKEINECVYSVADTDYIYFFISGSASTLASKRSLIQQTIINEPAIDYKPLNQIKKKWDLPKFASYSDSLPYHSDLIPIIGLWVEGGSEKFSKYAPEIIRSAREQLEVAQEKIQQEEKSLAEQRQRVLDRETAAKEAEKKRIAEIYSKTYSKTPPKIKAEISYYANHESSFMLNIISTDDYAMIVEKVIVNNKPNCTLKLTDYLTTGDKISLPITGCGAAIKVDVHTNRGAVALKFQ